MLWRIDPSRDEPLYAQLVVQAHLAAARGDLAPGDRLPAARDLAASLDLNVHTVLKAYQRLRDDGLIELRRGRGAVVTSQAGAGLPPVESAITALVQAARAANLSADTAAELVKEAMNR